ncbi:18630_t:CDS:1, partial [Gigaspora rosea]
LCLFQVDLVLLPMGSCKAVVPFLSLLLRVVVLASPILSSLVGSFLEFST